MCNSTALNHPLFIEKSAQIINDNFKETIAKFFQKQSSCELLDSKD